MTPPERPVGPQVVGPRLRARGLEVAFAKLGPIDLEVGVREAVALVGPSGCGKSTILLALAGLVPPSDGEAIATGAGPPGMVFQDPTLMGWANVIENVALPLTLARAPDARARATAALAAAGLAGAERQRPAALSGGMRMRVALARALVTGADTLLLDEPFAAIDEFGRRALDDLVLRLKAERGLSVLLVTHSVEEAVYMADRVLVMSPRPGRIVAQVAVRREGQSGDAFLASAGFVEAAAGVRAALAAGRTHAPAA